MGAPVLRALPWTCARKNHFGTWSQAERAARNIRHGKGSLVEPYRCSCGGVVLGGHDRVEAARRRAWRRRKAEAGPS